MRYISGTLDLYYEDDERGYLSTKGYAITPYPSGSVRDRKTEAPYRLKDGDLVTIFGSVAKADVHWNDTIDMQRYPGSMRGTQKNVDPNAWKSMFFDGMPARIERGGQIFQGGLEPFCETGTEGIVWSLHEFGKLGYEGLVPLEKGDLLTVFKNVSDGKIEFSDKIIFDDKPALWGNDKWALKYPPAPKSFQNSSDWCKYVLFKYPVIARLP